MTDFTSEKHDVCASCPLYNVRRINNAGPNKSAIVIVGDAPSTKTPLGASAFSDRSGTIVTTILKKLQNYYRQLKPTASGIRRWAELDPLLMYAVSCVTDDRPRKEAFAACSDLLHTKIRDRKPRVVIALGAEAAKAVLKQNVKFDAVAHTIQKGAFYDVLVTYSPKAVLLKPGLFADLYRDIQRAFLHAEGHSTAKPFTEDFLRQQYIFPRTVQEVKEVCDTILEYGNATHSVAVDTETSSLEMYDPNAAIIMISFAWDYLKATSIVLDHPKKWWTPEELEQVKYHVRRVLKSNKPKIFQHEKFDRQGLAHRYAWEINNVVWDTMCGEHLLEEDKKGAYGLKSLTKSFLPRYAGYEDKVSEYRAAHGGSNRAEEAKRYRRALKQFEKDYADYAEHQLIYEGALQQYEGELRAWEQRRIQEKERAALARKQKKDKALRKMRKEAVGKKPGKPKIPKRPVKPEPREPFNFTIIPLDNLELYACVDADVTRQLAMQQYARMTKEQTRDINLCKRHKLPTPKPFRSLMQSHYIPTNRTLADMEFTGFPVDIPYIEKLDKELTKVIEKTETQLYELAGKKFVINNPAELGKIMFSDGFFQDRQRVYVPLTNNIKRTSKGQISSNEKTLKYIANTYGYDFPKTILTYRKAAKVQSTFLAEVYDHALFSGRGHSTFHIVGTGTGRLSSSNYNQQNIPKKLAGYNVKKIFVPPPGYVLCNTDAKGAEIRIFAAYSQDEKLIKAILDGLDTHSFFTANVFGETYEAIEEARVLVDRKDITSVVRSAAEALVRKRTNCKRVVFGTLYGALAPKIAETAGISLEEAQEVIDLMFQMFPSIPAYINHTQMEVAKLGWVCTNTGRKRRFALANVRNFRNRCFRQAVNFKIQSTSSDLVLWVLNQIHPVIKNDMRGQFHATVHDSVVFSVPHNYVAQLPDLMYKYGTARVAKQFPWLPVPFLWDVEVGPSYGEVIDIDQYLQQQTSVVEEHEEVITDEEIKTEINEYYTDPPKNPETQHRWA